MINIKDFDLRVIKIDKKTVKSIAIYYIEYITKKKDAYNINSINLFYLLVHEIDGLIEKKKEINT